MKANEPGQLNRVFELILKQRGLWRQYTEARIINQWPTIVGKTIARQTSKIEFKGDTLFIKITSSVIRTELLMLKTQLIDVINSKAGGQLIQDIVIT